MLPSSSDNLEPIEQQGGMPAANLAQAEAAATADARDEKSLLASTDASETIDSGAQIHGNGDSL
jgi:hypothetical protein